jgi:type IV pilus assembly protein PilW
MAEKMRKVNDNGFTLVELLVATAIMGVIMAGIYAAFYSQHKSYAAQEDVAIMQQNLRAGIYHVERDIRMAGYDPTSSGLFGLEANGSDGRLTGANDIYFTVDDNKDGVEDNTDAEQIAFRLDAGNLEKYSTGADPWLTVAENINSLEFVYNDRDGIPTATLSEVRSIRITLTAQGDLRQKTLTAEVKCRNFGL